MFKSEASLFLSANNKVNSAKTLINECKRLIIDFNLEGNTDCNNLKNNINGCDIDALVTLVENTKTSLMEFEEGFAGDYMALLEEYLNNPTLDTTQMSDEEMMQYSIYMRDYNQILLYTLEKYEAAGMLTEEMEGYLAYQRELVAQYDLQDQMAVLDPASDEYIELFKQNADYSRNLISLNPNLTPEQKESYLAEFEIEYEENLAALTTARDEKVQRQQDEQELQELYDSKEDNNGFFHPFVESSIDEAILDKRIEMGIATEDEIEYKNMGGFDRFLVDSGTFLTSTYAGLFNIVEGMSDGVVMLTSAVGTDEYKSWATEYISRDISGEMYQGIVLSTDMNSYSAYGTWHDAGLVFGETLGKAGMTFAAPWANALMSGFNAMGQSAETSFINGEDYWMAFGKSVVHGVAGAAEGYAGSKMNLQFRELVNSGALKVVGKSALDGLRNVGTTLASPGGLKIVGGNLLNIVKSQAPTVLKTAGMATLKDADTWIETGCTLASNILEGVGNGDIDWKQTLLETGTVFAMNYGMNFISGMAFDINASTNKYKQDFNTEMEAMSDAERSKAWEDYFNQKYGADVVEHTSGKYDFKHYKDTSVSRYGQDVYDKFENIIQNPKYYDPDTGFIWPQAEGALEYSGMTDVELYKIGTTQGITGLKENGAVISVYEEGKVDTRIGASYGEFSGSSDDSIKSRALSPNTEISTAKDLHVYENIDDWTTINQDIIDSAVYGEPFTGYSQVADGDRITGIVKVETTAAPWFDSPGGAKQYVYYGVKADGTIATKVLSDGTKQLYKFNMDQLMHMGVIDDITSSVDPSLLDSSLIPRLAN